jgi:hypothetical protein
VMLRRHELSEPASGRSRGSSMRPTSATSATRRPGSRPGGDHPGPGFGRRRRAHAPSLGANLRRTPPALLAPGRPQLGGRARATCRERGTSETASRPRRPARA